MRRMRGVILPALVLHALLPKSAEAQEFDRAVLEASPFLPVDSIAVIYSAIREWTESQTSGIDPQQAVRAREDLYRVIQSLIWYTTIETGQTHLTGSDNAAQVFDLATYLGVYGAGLVARDLALDPALDLAPPLLPEAPLSLSYTRPHYSLESAAWWGVEFPYYFMPWLLERGPPEGGSVEFSVISTLHGTHVTAPRTSQATIMILASKLLEPQELARTWRAKLGVPETATCPEDDWPIEGVTNHACHFNADGIRVEMGMLTSTQGGVLFIYSGLDGTYQSNRSHFISVLRTFSWREAF